MCREFDSEQKLNPYHGAWVLLAGGTRCQKMSRVLEVRIKGFFKPQL